MEFAGEFETHFTLAETGEHHVAALRDWGAARGLKCVHILLDAGKTPSQPMLTRLSHGTLSSERAAAQALTRDLAAAGFRVVRVKIEASPKNRDIPYDDLEAATRPRIHHFEHHVKLILGASDDVTAIAELAKQHAARVSRNALRTRADGRQERFVTQRCYGVGQRTADVQLHALLNGLDAAGYERVETDREYVVFDDNLALDAGWLNREA